MKCLHRLPLLLLTLAFLAHINVSAQSTVRPSPSGDGSFVVDGDDTFFPIGWMSVGGSCAVPDADSRAEVGSDIQYLKSKNVNLLLEIARADGRVVPMRVTDEVTGGDHWNFEWGHPLPAAYVDGLRFTLQEAQAGTNDAYVLADLNAFFTSIARVDTAEDGVTLIPNPDRDIITCAQYQQRITDEIASNPMFDATDNLQLGNCGAGGAAATRPVWEWNIRYVIDRIHNEDNLFGWFLVDEPEGGSHDAIFGRDNTPYTGFASLPTVQFLEYVYTYVKQTEAEYRGTGNTHPVVVDVNEPHWFFDNPGNRYGWNIPARGGVTGSGPFDINGRIPGDIVGMEMNGQFRYTHAVGGLAPLWIGQDASFPFARGTAMLDDVRNHYNSINYRNTFLGAGWNEPFWGTMVLAAQANLPDAAGVGSTFPSPHPSARNNNRCVNNDNPNNRDLGPRELEHQLITSLIDGVGGFVYYSHHLLPDQPAGQTATHHPTDGLIEFYTNNLIDQFIDANLHTVSQNSTSLGVTVDNIYVAQLTDYFRTEHNTTEGINRINGVSRCDPGPLNVTMNQYTWANFGRVVSAADASIGGYTGTAADWGGQAYFRLGSSAINSINADYHHLRVGEYAHSGHQYIYVSNTFDAYLEVKLSVPSNTLFNDSDVYLGDFQLFNQNGAINWRNEGSHPMINRVDFNSTTNRWEIVLYMHPYDSHILRWSNI